jgi:anti-sigma regulatory factor (Ser/Thr protein kinase)
MPQIALDLPANEDAPARAREALREIAATVGSETRWRAELVVTELVTNAVLHGPGGPVALALACGGAGVRGTVADPGAGIAGRRSGRAAGEGGRGLFIVDRLTDGWGMSDGASRVWFEIGSHA